MQTDVQTLTSASMSSVSAVAFACIHVRHTSTIGIDTRSTDGFGFIAVESMKDDLHTYHSAVHNSLTLSKSKCSGLQNSLMFFGASSIVSNPFSGQPAMDHRLVLVYRPSSAHGLGALRPCPSIDGATSFAHASAKTKFCESGLK